MVPPPGELATHACRKDTIMQIGAFVPSLMMVGVVTFPVEKRTFGFKLALTRNLLAFAFALCVAFVLAMVLGARS